MDLLVQLANSVNFTFDLHLVEDGSYGTYEKVNTDFQSVSDDWNYHWLVLLVVVIFLYLLINYILVDLGAQNDPV